MKSYQQRTSSSSLQMAVSTDEFLRFIDKLLNNKKHLPVKSPSVPSSQVLEYAWHHYKTIWNYKSIDAD